MLVEARRQQEGGREEWSWWGRGGSEDITVRSGEGEEAGEAGLALSTTNPHAGGGRGGREGGEGGGGGDGGVLADPVCPDGAKYLLHPEL